MVKINEMNTKLEKAETELLKGLKAVVFGDTKVSPSSWANDFSLPKIYTKWINTEEWHYIYTGSITYHFWHH